MKNKSLQKFKADCLKVIKNYQTDLDYDIQAIKNNKVSIFFAYESGSHSIELIPFLDYPKKGEKVKYLFGQADREHILNEVGRTMECESIKNAKLVHYFDGEKIYEINHETAKKLISDYKLRMHKAFKYA